jgi:hypothetical protein
MVFAKKARLADKFGYTKQNCMKAKHILILTAALALCSSGFCQTDSVQTGSNRPSQLETGVFLTTDQGETWKPADTGLPKDSKVSGWVVARNNSIFLASVNYGIFKSSDGKSWSSCGAGLPKGALPSTIAIHDNVLFVGSYGKGVFSSNDYGNTWKTSGNGIDDLAVHCFYSQDNKLFAGTDRGIYTSENYGISWTHVTGTMHVNEFREADGVLFASTNHGALRSEDRGKNWSWAWSGSPLFALATDGGKVFSLGEANRIYGGQITDQKWFMPDVFLSSYTFRITPASPPILLPPWKNVFRSLRENRPFENTGLPVDMSFDNLLVTPFGILVARKGGGC